MDTFRATSDTIACTLTPDDLKETQAAWDKLLRVSLVSREEVPGGLRLIVHPGRLALVEEIVGDDDLGLVTLAGLGRHHLRRRP